ncbi:MAG: hypothetical protein IQL11_06670, partial [Bacteroidales bacterium]|nr:hypothetical protein [Bacteroidales bacterium]
MKPFNEVLIATRKVLRTCRPRILIIVVLLTLFIASCSDKQYQVFIEAESFEDRGEWTVDPQFVEQMGSPYLLAHGLGIPVGDAATRVAFPGKGRYHVWARAMNWAPGSWDAPGRFNIIVDGEKLEEILG